MKNETQTIWTEIVLIHKSIYDVFEKYDVEEDNKECIREIEDQISYNSSIKEVLGKMSTKFEN